MDEFTRKYYRDTYGIECRKVKVEMQEDAPIQQTKSVLKDSSKEKKDFQKLLDNDGKVLRFAAFMNSKRPEDQGRLFIVSYYLVDDTVGIYEPPQRYYHPCCDTEVFQKLWYCWWQVP